MLLKSFRNASQSLFIKILFAAIIFSFCLWGVGDIIKNYSASKTVFSVNKQKTTVEQFLTEYSQEKQRIRNIGSKPLSDEEMAKLNISGMVLDKLLNISVLEQTFQKLNIIVSKKSLLEIIHSLPEFQNNGSFDSNIYETAIRRSGISEGAFIMQIRDNVARTQLIHPIIAGYKLPTLIKNSIAAEFDAKNTVLISRFDINSTKYDSVPSEDELKEYYANNTDKYKTSESRDLSILIVDYQKLAGDIDLDEEEVNSYYEENKSLYEPKETRDFERFIFDTRDNADKGWALINQGSSTAEVVKKLTPDMEVVRDTTTSDFPETVGSELFNLGKNKCSNVFSIGGKFYVYKLVKITSEKQKTESEIKSEIRDNLKKDRLNTPEFYSKIKEMKNKIDDGFGSGKTIEEVAKETGMDIATVDKMEKTVDAPDLTKVIPDEDTRTEIVENAFATDEQQASQMIDSKETDSLSYVVFVRNIKKETVPSFEEIKDRVREDYIFEKKDKIVMGKINEILEKSRKASKEVSSLPNVQKFVLSKKDLLTSKETPSTEVNKILKVIPNPNVILNIISTLKSGEANYYKISENEYLVFAIDDIKKSQNISLEFVQVMSRYLDQTTANDVIPISMAAFKSKLKINIDEELLKNITKESDTHEDDPQQGF